VQAFVNHIQYGESQCTLQDTLIEQSGYPKPGVQLCLKIPYATPILILMYYIYHFDTSDQRKPQGHISHITPTTGRQDIALWLGLYSDITLATMPLILRHTFNLFIVHVYAMSM